MHLQFTLRFLFAQMDKAFYISYQFHFIIFVNPVQGGSSLAVIPQLNLVKLVFSIPHECRLSQIKRLGWIKERSWESNNVGKSVMVEHQILRKKMSYFGVFFIVQSWFCDLLILLWEK